jgi:hypothetical protein
VRGRETCARETFVSGSETCARETDSSAGERLVRGRHSCGGVRQISPFYALPSYFPTIECYSTCYVLYILLLDKYNIDLEKSLTLLR